MSASGVRRCWPPPPCSRMTATWGSTFFLIHDLLDRVPTLDFLAVRFALAGRAAAGHRAPGAWPGCRPVAARRAWCWACCTASRRSCRPPAWRTRRPASRASSPACTSSPPRCWRPCCCAPGSPRLTWAAVVLAVAGLGVLTLERPQRRVRRGGHAGGRRALRAAHRRARRLVDARDALGHVDPADPGDRRGVPGRDGPGRRSCCPRPAATGCRWSTWRSSPARSRCSGQTWAQAHLPPTRTRDHHEHGAGLRGVLRGAARRRGRRPRGCSSAALMVLTAMLVVELVPRRRVEAEVSHIAV